MPIQRDFILSLIGGILVTITGIMEYVFDMPLLFWNLSFIGIIFGLLIIVGSLLIKYEPYGIRTKHFGLGSSYKFPLGGFIVLICSLVSLTFLQGLLIGPMLGIIASTSSYNRCLKLT
jgi:hypothetical protein